MNNLLTEIKTAVKNEYDRAAEKHGKTHNSDHEAYAVILEEFEEAMGNATVFKLTLQNFWNNVKGNIKNTGLLDELYEEAVQATAEMAQVAAMCLKATKTKER